MRLRVVAVLLLVAACSKGRYAESRLGVRRLDGRGRPRGVRAHGAPISGLPADVELVVAQP